MTTDMLQRPDWRGLCEELTEHLALLDEPPHELVCRAQNALAQPEPEVVGPSDEELRELYLATMLDADRDEDDFFAFARAVLARWGRPAPAPAGERQAAPVPVAVSERLPGVRDCAPWPGEPDASAWCWVGSDVDGGWSWEQRSAGCLAAFPDDFTHWLPAHALPIPNEDPQP